MYLCIRIYSVKWLYEESTIRYTIYIFAAALAAGCGGHENGREVQPADSLFVAEMARAKAYSSEREGNLDSARIVLEQLVRQEGLSLEQSLNKYRPEIRPALREMIETNLNEKKQYSIQKQ